MRIGLVGPTYPFRGGIAHHTTLLVRHLRAAGHEVCFLSFTRQYPGWLYRGQSDRDPSPQPLQTKTEYLIDSLNPWTWWQAANRLRRWQPEVLLLPWWVPFWAPAWAFLGRRVKRGPGRPRLLFLCHNVLPHEAGPGDRLALRLALAPGDAFIVHAAAEAAKLRRFFADVPVAVTPLPTYADLGAQATTPPLPDLPSDRPLLLFCGFVRPYKGLDVLLDALPRLRRDRPLHLAIVGEFWGGSATYQAQIERNGLSAGVTVVDRYVADDVLAAYIRAAAVVVLPYRSATQSAILQTAFGLGTPVITTNVGGLPDVVADGVTGLLVPPADPAALATAIDRYFDEDLGPLMRGNIARTQEQFSWDHLLKVIEELAVTK